MKTVDKVTQLPVQCLLQRWFILMNLSEQEAISLSFQSIVSNQFKLLSTLGRIKPWITQSQVPYKMSAYCVMVIITLKTIVLTNRYYFTVPFSLQWLQRSPRAVIPTHFNEHWVTVIVFKIKIKSAKCTVYV